MQQGSARPLAVKYITAHGRRHSDQGFLSALRVRLSPGSVAPEALKLMPRAGGLRFGRRKMLRLLPAQALEQRLIGPRHADRSILAEHETLQVDLLHADVVRDAHEVGQLGDGLLQARQP